MNDVALNFAIQATGISIIFVQLHDILTLEYAKKVSKLIC